MKCTDPLPPSVDVQLRADPQSLLKLSDGNGDQLVERLVVDLGINPQKRSRIEFAESALAFSGAAAAAPLDD